jgi:hypothetical protein
VSLDSPLIPFGCCSKSIRFSRGGLIDKREGTAQTQMIYIYIFETLPRFHFGDESVGRTRALRLLSADEDFDLFLASPLLE